MNRVDKGDVDVGLDLSERMIAGSKCSKMQQNDCQREEVTRSRKSGGHG